MGGQRKQWEDNIKEWMGPSITESLRASNDRKGWHELIKTPVMAPLRPPEVLG